MRPIAEKLSAAGEDFKMLICPDHPTPISVRTHVSDPVPYLLYASNRDLNCGAVSYDEQSAEKTGIFVAEGKDLMPKLFRE